MAGRVVLDYTGQYGSTREAHEMADVVHGMILAVSPTFHIHLNYSGQYLKYILAFSKKQHPRRELTKA